MKIDIEKLKAGDIILSYDAEEEVWTKVLVMKVEENSVLLRDQEGAFEGYTYNEAIENLKNEDYYKV